MKTTFAQYAHFYLNTGLKGYALEDIGLDEIVIPSESILTLSGWCDPSSGIPLGDGDMHGPIWSMRSEEDGLVYVSVANGEIKPMMRPLSSLTKEITNGVVPIVELAKMARFESDENNKAEFRGVGKPPYGYAPTKYKPHYDCWYQFRRGQAWNIIYDNLGLYVKESHHGWYESMAVNMPDLYQQLLKWHFNLWLDPSEFIEINESKTITGRKALKNSNMKPYSQIQIGQVYESTLKWCGSKLTYTVVAKDDESRLIEVKPSYQHPSLPQTIWKKCSDRLFGQTIHIIALCLFSVGATAQFTLKPTSTGFTFGAKDSCTYSATGWSGGRNNGNKVWIGTTKKNGWNGMKKGFTFTADLIIESRSNGQFFGKPSTTNLTIKDSVLNVDYVTPVPELPDGTSPLQLASGTAYYGSFPIPINKRLTLTVCYDAGLGRYATLIGSVKDQSRYLLNPTEVNITKDGITLFDGLKIRLYSAVLTTGKPTVLPKGYEVNVTPSEVWIHHNDAGPLDVWVTVLGSNSGSKVYQATITGSELRIPIALIGNGVSSVRVATKIGDRVWMVRP